MHFIQIQTNQNKEVQNYTNVSVLKTISVFKQPQNELKSNLAVGLYISCVDISCSISDDLTFKMLFSDFVILLTQKILHLVFSIA